MGDYDFDWEVQNCKTRECRKPIVFVKVSSTTGSGTTKHSTMPIEYDLDTGRPTEFIDNGTAGRVQVIPSLNLSVDDQDGYLRMVSTRVLGKGEPADPGAPIWLSHFATCPEAEQWRSKQS